MRKIQKIFVIIGLFLFASSTFSETNSIKPVETNNANQKRIHDYVERARMAVKNPRTTFSCQGIGMQDNGSALDGDIYYFRESTHELISMSGMVFCISAATEAEADPKLFCPPHELRTDFCVNKYKKMKYNQCVSYRNESARKWYEETYHMVMPPCEEPQ